MWCTPVQIRQHNSRESCWFVRDGRVYDATHFLRQHPGGAAAILGQAGKPGHRAAPKLPPAGSAAALKARLFYTAADV